MEKLILDVNDLRGSTLVKIIDREASVVVMFGFYRDSDGTNGKLILPQGTQVDAKMLAEIIRILVAAYPLTDWTVVPNNEENFMEE